MRDQEKKDVSNDYRKVFVGGITRETTKGDLMSCFSKFGSVEAVEIKTEPGTGRPRGFAFIVFESQDSVEAVLNAGEIFIRNRKVDAKRAISRTGKVFVGGVPQEATEDEIKAVFEPFGKIVQIEAPIDKLRNQRKSYIFITFEHEESMKNLLQQPKHILCGKEIEAKTVTSRLNDQQQKPSAHASMAASYGALGLGGGGQTLPASYAAAVDPLASLNAYSNWAALAQQQWPGYDPVAAYLGAAQAAAGYGGLGYAGYGYDYGASASAAASGAARGGHSGVSSDAGAASGHHRYHPY